MEALQIPIHKGVVILYENELLTLLANSPDIAKKAFGRGKGLKRVESNLKRQAQGFDRWQLYEVLKGNRHIDECTYDWIRGMSHTELVEGVLAYMERLKQR